MTLEVAIRGDLKAMMRDEAKALRKSATIAVRRAARGARRDLIRQIKRSVKTNQGLSRKRPEQWVIAKLDPQRGFKSNNPTGVVSGRARYRRRAGEVDLLTILDEGATVTARSGKFLAIPTENAPLRSGRGGARRAMPSEVRIPVDILPARGGRAVIVRRGTREVLWTLVREVRLPKRIDAARSHAKRTAKIVDDFISQLAKEDVKLEKKWGL